MLLKISMHMPVSCLPLFPYYKSLFLPASTPVDVTTFQKYMDLQFRVLMNKKSVFPFKFVEKHSIVVFFLGCIFSPLRF
jgi:hypothetical protein